MKTREYKFKWKKELKTVTVPIFEDMAELTRSVSSEELLKVYHYGQLEIAKRLETGRDPFLPKKRKLSLKLRELTEAQIKTLVKMGLLSQD